MAAIFEKSGLGTAAEFEKAATDTSLAASFDPGAKTLEGYLFPTPTRSAAQRRCDRDRQGHGRCVRSRVRRRASCRSGGARDEHARGRDARVARREGDRTGDERPLVAAVYHNRLEQRMPLQCDPTVIYALMRAGRWNGNIRKQDLQIDSPYNTYRVSRPAARADRLTRPRVARGRRAARERAVSLFREPQRRHARLRRRRSRSTTATSRSGRSRSRGTGVFPQVSTGEVPDLGSPRSGTRLWKPVNELPCPYPFPHFSFSRSMSKCVRDDVRSSRRRAGRAPISHHVARLERRRRTGRRT